MRSSVTTVTKDKASPGSYSVYANQQVTKEDTCSVVTISYNLAVHTSHSCRQDKRGGPAPTVSPASRLPGRHIEWGWEHFPGLLRLCLKAPWWEFPEQQCSWNARLTPLQQVLRVSAGGKQQRCSSWLPELKSSSTLPQGHTTRGKESWGRQEIETIWVGWEHSQAPTPQSPPINTAWRRDYL